MLFGRCRRLGESFLKMSKRCKLDLAGSSTMPSQIKPSEDDHRSAKTNVHKNNELTYLQTPIKAKSDKKNYSVVQLPNGLTALLISDSAHLINLEDDGSISSSESEQESEDSETESSGESTCSSPTLPKKSPSEEKMAACALCVSVGSFSDPEDIPGLAHFLEHMVFMGSEKYPQENEFDVFIKRKGGSDNASTECEYTTFYFECNDQNLHKGMDMFSQFFIAPLMKREAMTREREAIESEFQISLPSDCYRKQQLIAETATDKNALKKFMWGNLQTLRDNITDDYLSKSVHGFWKRHYTAHRMHLAVQARLPLEVLENWVVECFSSVPNNGLPPLPLGLPLEEAFDMNKFCRMYFVEPVKDICELEISWVMPSVMEWYKSKPAEYLSWIIGHEGKGSLVSYLREKLWALDITAGHGDDGCVYNSMFTIFSITINLTEDGYLKLVQVLEAIFSYIKMLHISGPQKRLFDEIQKIEDINFEFSEEQPPVDYVESLVEVMQYYPPQDYITGCNLYFEYKPELITKLLEYLIPSKANIMVSSKKVRSEYVLDHTEKWFKTRYTSKPIPAEVLETLEKVEVFPAFHLPEPNNFIPTNFSLLPSPDTVSKYPEKVLSTDLIEVYYKQDVKFKLPLSYIGCNIITNIAHNSAKNAALQDVFNLGLKQLLVEEVYPANMAQLEFHLSTSEKGLELTFNGFNEKLSLLVEKVMRRIVSFQDNVTKGLFIAMKKVMLRQYLNSCLRPGFLSKDVRMKITLVQAWSAVEKYNALYGATLEDLKHFCDVSYKNVFLQCLVQGNISLNEALGICNHIAETMRCSPLPVELYPEIRVCELPKGEVCCRVRSFNPEDCNCVTTNYFQMGPGKIKEYCLIEVLLMLMEEPIFDTLRTQEQLGYDVSCTLRDTFGILGFSVTVVSQINKYCVDHVETRITAFLKKFSKILDELPKEEFEDAVASLIKLKKCGDVHLKEEVKRNWDEIKSCEYVFDRLEKEIAEISKVKLSGAKNFFKEQIGLENEENFKKLTVQVVGYNNSKSDDINETHAKNILNSSDKTMIQFQVVKDDPNRTNNYFLQDIYSYNKNLNVFPINKVT